MTYHAEQARNVFIAMLSICCEWVGIFFLNSNLIVDSCLVLMMFFCISLRCHRRRVYLHRFWILRVNAFSQFLLHVKQEWNCSYRIAAV